MLALRANVYVVFEAGAVSCTRPGDVAELADALDLGSSGETRGGSSPLIPICSFFSASLGFFEPTSDRAADCVVSLLRPVLRLTAYEVGLCSVP
jgi:hypothetical protein